MDVIPVLDLMGGQVVHARRGDRDAYRPIESRLTAGSDPLAVTAALLAVAPFRTLYVADLDAIRGRGGHDRTIAALAATFRDLEIWVDRGETDVLRLRERATAGPGVSVLGTESFSDAAALTRALATGDCVLSLDHDASGVMGPPEAHRVTLPWPRRVIVMTLARVGAGQGPDIARLEAAKVMAGDDREVFAAGGVRGLDDLLILDRMGLAGALVASALHDGRLGRETLRRVPARPRRTGLRP